MSHSSQQLPQTPAWQKLQQVYKQTSNTHMRELFAGDPQRFDRFSVEGPGLILDYSKNRVSDDVLQCLFALAREQNVAAAISQLFRGDKLNVTEHRAVLHTALRDRSNTQLVVDGVDVRAEVGVTLGQMRQFCEAVREGVWRGASNQAITDVIAIGIGGSGLGPALVDAALSANQTADIKVHFITNIDPQPLLAAFERLNAAKTLVVVASKSFTTLETAANARAARTWLQKSGISEVHRHFVAITANKPAAIEFGVDPGNIFAFWDWVGGRYSLWSAIGLPIALAFGMEAFEQLLAGANEVDQHFREAPLERNIPVIMALLGIWYVNLFGTSTHAVVPYDESLKLLPDYLQQLEMESNGKSVRRDGTPATYKTAPVIWGGVGTEGQHAFFQLLHQGTHLVPVDFLVPLRRATDIPGHHSALVANAYAQSRALMWGRTEAETRQSLSTAGLSTNDTEKLATHRSFPGNNPGNTILYEWLNPRVLGALLAIYEHKVFVQGVLWDINSFDQWGVELGKDLAESITENLNGKGQTSYDSSTAGLISRYQAAQD